MAQDELCKINVCSHSSQTQVTACSCPPLTLQGKSRILPGSQGLHPLTSVQSLSSPTLPSSETQATGAPGPTVPSPGSPALAHAQLPQVGSSTILTLPTRSSPGDFYQPLEKHRSHHFLQEFSVILPFTQSAMFFSVLVLCV